MNLRTFARNAVITGTLALSQVSHMPSSFAQGAAAKVAEPAVAQLMAHADTDVANIRGCVAKVYDAQAKKVAYELAGTFSAVREAADDVAAEQVGKPLSLNQKWATCREQVREYTGKAGTVVKNWLGIVSGETAKQMEDTSLNYADAVALQRKGGLSVNRSVIKAQAQAAEAADATRPAQKPEGSTLSRRFQDKIKNLAIACYAAVQMKGEQRSNWTKIKELDASDVANFGLAPQGVKQLCNQNILSVELGGKSVASLLKDGAKVTTAVAGGKETPETVKRLTQAKFPVLSRGVFVTATKTELDKAQGK